MIHSIPQSDILNVKHYPKNMLITTRDGTLYTTGKFSIIPGYIIGKFEQEPYRNAVSTSRVQCTVPNDGGFSNTD